MMAISELELSAVLGYCRALLDAADQLDTAGRQRSAVVTGALRAWNGPHGQVFAAAGQRRIE